MVVTYRNRFNWVCGVTLALIIIPTIVSIYILFYLSANLANSGLKPIPPIIPLFLQFSLFLLIVGFVLNFYSLYLLAKAKGYTGWLILLGLINIFGLLFLVLLPDRRKTAKGS